MKKFLLSILIISIFFCCGCGASGEVVTMDSNAESSPEVTASSPIAEGDELLGLLQISELMAKNRSTLRDDYGEFSDWIELVNCSDKSLNLSGWSISDGKGQGWILPEKELAPGEFMLIFASGRSMVGDILHTDFKLSAGETVNIITPMGNVSHSLVCSVDDADVSVIQDGNPCRYPTPGFENSSQGYDAWQDSRFYTGPLIINEVVVSNIFGNSYTATGNDDWVEIKNISSKTVNLSEFYLSDQDEDYQLWRFPDMLLGPGEFALVLCNDEGSSKALRAPFDLSSSEETLYLSHGRELIDYVTLRDIPIEGSYGRVKGENGFFYFDSVSPKKDNPSGYRRVSEKPVSLSADGVFNNVGSVTVELEGKGKIYYTLDGSLPTKRSHKYTGPISIDSTTVVRAISIEDGALPSQALTLSYILNENHSLPVLSIVSDSTNDLRNLLKSKNKTLELPGSVSLYEEDGSFSIGCGISLSGHQSLELFKKSMKLSFRGVYGDSNLDYDVFDIGVEGYDSLSIRAGQDNHRTVLRQEIWQDLALEMSDLVSTQHSKFCVAYLNGKYYGIYCIKENISSQYFADQQGVSDASVDDVKVPDTMTVDFENSIFNFCKYNDLSKPENYQYICNLIDIDSYIDWAILQGSCGNVDLFRNVRFFRSSEIDGKWKSVYFDLDHAMLDDFGGDFLLGHTLPGEYWPFMSMMGYSSFSNSRMALLFTSLLSNDEFKDRFLTRYAEVYDTYLSNERILERIDHYEALLAPEIERDWTRWSAEPEQWPIYVDMLRRAVNELDWQNYVKNALCYHLNLSDEEIAHYFG